MLYNFILCFHYRSSDIFLKDEDRQIATLDQDKIKEDTIALLKKICQSDVGTNYKLGKAHRDLNLNIYNLSFICLYNIICAMNRICQRKNY